MERKTWKIVLKKGIAAGIDYDTNSSTYQDPEQVLTYVEAHDNHTLWDKLELTNSGDSESAKTNAQIVFFNFINITRSSIFTCRARVYADEIR